MRTLHRHQYELRAAILNNISSQLGTAIVEGRLSAAEQVDIYRNHYRFTLIDALKATFPVVEKLVGENFFAVMAWRFIGRHPPTGPVLFEYGESLAGFVEECHRLDGLPYLSDVARLEWALNAAYHASDTAAIPLADLAALPPDQVAAVSLKFHPSVRFLRSPYPVDAIWHANQPNAATSTVVSLDDGGARLVTYRRGFDIEWRSLTLAEDAFLAALESGVTLETAHSAATALGDFDLAPTLAWSFGAGLFTEIVNGDRAPSLLNRGLLP
jgi:hypothetical protein